MLPTRCTRQSPTTSLRREAVSLLGHANACFKNEGGCTSVNFCLSMKGTVKRMIDISSARVVHCVVHKVGNRLREEGFLLSSDEIKGNADLHGTLLRHYLAPLIQERLANEFYHESDIGLNALHQFSRRIFERPLDFVTQTQNVAKHLYSASNHPSVLGGELISIFYTDVRVNEESRLAMGIYKIEERESFLDVVEEGGKLNLVEHRGIPIRIQKGALILEGTNEVFSKEAGNNISKYWTESFLKVRPKRTPTVSAKLAANLIKEVDKRLEVDSRITLRSGFEALINHGDSVSFRSIREVGEQYLGANATAEIMGVLEERSGFSVPDDHQIETARLRRQARSVSRQFSIMDGVSLILTLGGVRLQGCGLQKTRTGARITIDINVENK